jgi:hypothetical protein
MVIVETHDSRQPFQPFCFCNPAASAGIPRDYDRVMIAAMSSRIYQRIHSGSLAVEHPPTSVITARTGLPVMYIWFNN